MKSRHNDCKGGHYTRRIPVIIHIAEIRVLYSVAALIRKVDEAPYS